MNKKLSAILSLVLILSLGLSLPAKALDKEQGEISVNITEYKEVAPDTAEISFAIKTYDSKSIQNANYTNKEISKKVYETLNNFIDSKNGDYIKTSSFNAVPIYSYVNSKKVFEKYEVSNNVTVRTKSIDKLGALIDGAIKSGDRKSVV